jgi:hypothetical protein
MNGSSSIYSNEYKCELKETNNTTINIILEKGLKIKDHSTLNNKTSNQ